MQERSKESSASIIYHSFPRCYDNSGMMCLSTGSCFDRKNAGHITVLDLFHRECTENERKARMDLFSVLSKDFAVLPSWCACGNQTNPTAVHSLIHLLLDNLQRQQTRLIISVVQILSNSDSSRSARTGFLAEDSL